MRAVKCLQRGSRGRPIVHFGHLGVRDVHPRLRGLRGHVYVHFGHLLGRASHAGGRASLARRTARNGKARRGHGRRGCAPFFSSAPCSFLGQRGDFLGKRGIMGKAPPCRVR
jgi:hypothetical protein